MCVNFGGIVNGIVARVGITVGSSVVAMCSVDTPNIRHKYWLYASVSTHKYDICYNIRG